MSDTKMTDQNVSEIDRALNAAKARKAAKEGKPSVSIEPKAATAPKAPREPKQPRITDEERTARATAKAAELAAKKAARVAVRAAKQAAKDASKAAPHLKKVERAASKLNPLTARAQLVFTEATASLTAAELANLALHINHSNRTAATHRALSSKVTVGQEVRITGGEPRFVGMTGTVVKSQRIRCYVAVQGSKKPLYLFTGDCEAIDAPVASATA
jgi:multidrug efflux pump subunit AcrA (membrane-fusion protein)